MALPERKFQTTKNPAGAGFFVVRQACGRWAAAPGSGELDRLHAGGQAALVARSLVLVDQAPRAEAVQDRLGDGKGRLDAGGVVGVQGLEDLLDGGAELRTLGSVACVAHDRLL